jgi:hypothetical protein
VNSLRPIHGLPHRYNGLMHAAPISHRRFRFSLRALFVAVTLCGAALGWLVFNWQWKRERDAYIAAVSVHPTAVVVLSAMPRGPLTIRLLGAESVDQFILPEESFDETERRRIARIFPEAVVREGRLGAPP